MFAPLPPSSQPVPEPVPVPVPVPEPKIVTVSPVPAPILPPKVGYLVMIVCNNLTNLTKVTNSDLGVVFVQP